MCSEATARLLIDLLLLGLSCGATVTPIRRYARRIAEGVRSGVCVQQGNGSTAHRPAGAHTQPRRYGSRQYAHHTAHGRQRRLVWAVRQQLESALIGCRSCSALALRRHPYAHQIAYGHHEWQGATAVSHCIGATAAPLRASHRTRPSDGTSAMARANTRITLHTAIRVAMCVRRTTARRPIELRSPMLSSGAMAHADTRITSHTATRAGMCVQHGNGSDAQ